MSSKTTPISSSGSESKRSLTPFPTSTIMIVDDEPTTIEILEMFLQSEGYEHFITTTDSTRALDLLARERPDVLLLDVMMPEVGGMEILTAIRNDESLRYTPVIILTSSTDAETKIQALELGATDFLAKPVDPSELALRLRNTLAAKVYQDRLTYCDALTGLPNRQLFMDLFERTLKQAAAHSTECALIHMDLDRFKQINDTLGHNVGDELLKAVASRLEQSMQATEFMGVPGFSPMRNPLARVGGDEFSLLLPGVGDADGAAWVAQRILSDLREPFRTNASNESNGASAEDLFITASIGISLFPADGSDAKTLLANANVAMSHAKKRGRNEYQFYNRSLNVESAERLSLENQLRRSIERDELLLYYQPRVDVQTGRLLGSEALMRWEHPELGLVGPDRFIPIAEETGIIRSLGEWALRTGCKQNQAWLSAGLPATSVAINVSALQFQNPGFVDTIRAALDESQMDPRYLDLELTESMIMRNPTETAVMLDAIKAMGIRLSIDDFGTGYSSLAYLKSFPISELKIDRSFVSGVPEDEDGAAIVNAIILIGHTLGMTVVAEGVETSEQLEFIKSRGCDSYQGFLLSKPLPAEEFQQLLLRLGRSGDIDSS